MQQLTARKFSQAKELAMRFAVARERQGEGYRPDEMRPHPNPLPVGEGVFETVP